MLISFLGNSQPPINSYQSLKQSPHLQSLGLLILCVGYNAFCSDALLGLLLFWDALALFALSGPSLSEAFCTCEVEWRGSDFSVSHLLPSLTQTYAHTQLQVVSILYFCSFLTS